jgi:hypothetical protein
MRRDLKAIYLRVFFDEDPEEIGNLQTYTLSHVLYLVKKYNVQSPPDRMKEIEVKRHLEHDPRESAQDRLESVLADPTSKVFIAAPEEIRRRRGSLRRLHGRDLLEIFAVWHHTDCSFPEITSMYSIAPALVALDIKTVVEFSLFRPVERKWKQLLLEAYGPGMKQLKQQLTSHSNQDLIPDKPILQILASNASSIQPLEPGGPADVIEAVSSSPSSRADEKTRSSTAVRSRERRKKTLARVINAKLPDTGRVSTRTLQPSDDYMPSESRLTSEEPDQKDARSMFTEELRKRFL